MITSIIFSKDRPLQLDLCLQSITQNFKECSRVVIIYECSSEDYKKQYMSLRDTYNKYEFWDQGSCLFRDIYHSILTESRNDFISFFTDDCIFYRPIEIGAARIKDMFDAEIIFCMSLRLGLNIVKRQLTTGQFFPETNPVLHKVDDDFVVAMKTSVNYGNYWSYSLSVDGHVFRKRDIQKMVSELLHIKSLYEWKNTPNEFESALQRFWPVTPEGIIAPMKSVVVNSPNNRVQDTHQNRNGDYYYKTPTEMLELFSSGKRIDFNKLKIENIQSPHTEINILEALV